MAEQMGVDAVVCLGDLDRAWIESLAGLRLPRVGVHGNHDEPDLLREVEVQDLHARRTSLGAAAARITVRRRRGAGWRAGCPAADVLLTHCPPYGINDDPDDPAHVGWLGLLEWVERHEPRHVLHGHTHPLDGHVTTRHGDTRVHWISGARVVVLD